VTVYDRVYRLWHGLDGSAAEVPPALRVEIHRTYRAVHLADRTLAQRGDRIGVLHLDNTRITAIHDPRLSPMAVGLEFRRLLIESLDTLAVDVRSGGRLAEVSAFMAVTIFHRGLRRLGFEAEPDGLFWPRVTAVYQRALLASLHPDGVLRLDRVVFAPAARLWISRDRLLALHGAGRRARQPRSLSPTR
jgi:hypothetical protein